MNKHELIFTIGNCILENKKLNYREHKELVENIMKEFNVDFDTLKTILEYLFSYKGHEAHFAECNTIEGVACGINNYCFDCNLTEDLLYYIYNVKYPKYNPDKITEEKYKEIKDSYVTIVGQLTFHLSVLTYTSHNLWYCAEKLWKLEEKLDEEFVKKIKRKYEDGTPNYRIYDSAYSIYTYMELEDIIDELESEIQKIEGVSKRFKKPEDNNKDMGYTYSKGTLTFSENIRKTIEEAEIVDAEKVYEEISALNI